MVAAATITTKGRITIPKSVRDKLRLKPGDKVQFEMRDDGTALVARATLAVRDLKGILPPTKRPITLEEMDRAIRPLAGKG